MSSPSARRVFVGLGSNLDTPGQQVFRAVEALMQAPGIELRQCSRLWRTAPWGEPDQPDFVNAVVELSSALPVAELLHQLKTVESQLGRVPDERRWGARRIDLDLLAAGSETHSGDDLQVPHPRLALRRFVLAPWAEIASAFVLPDGASVSRLLADCPDRGMIEALGPLSAVVPVQQLRDRIADYRRHRQSVALVPTMGHLHEGHLSLVARARAICDRVVVSLFVNPTQFGPGEDLASYPRTLAADCGALLAAGCDLVWIPRVADIYPRGLSNPTIVQVPVPAAGQLCDGSRPGHFSGVATVVARLLNAAAPDVAVFGQKDYQQLLLVRRMADDLLMKVQIQSAPVVRETSGLAMSSRNSYLSEEGRTRASALHTALQWLAGQLKAGARSDEALLARASEQLVAAGLTPEYLAVRNARDLSPPAPGQRRDLVILGAVRLGKTRLIDNVIVS